MLCPGWFGSPCIPRACLESLEGRKAWSSDSPLQPLVSSPFSAADPDLHGAAAPSPLPGVPTSHLQRPLHPAPPATCPSPTASPHGTPGAVCVSAGSAPEDGKTGWQVPAEKGGEESPSCVTDPSPSPCSDLTVTWTCEVTSTHWGASPTPPQPRARPCRPPCRCITCLTTHCTRTCHSVW